MNTIEPQTISHKGLNSSLNSNSSFNKYAILCSQITTDGYFSHEIKRLLLLERKTMTNLDSILKSRDNTLPSKV